MRPRREKQTRVVLMDGKNNLKEPGCVTVLEALIAMAEAKQVSAPKLLRFMIWNDKNFQLWIEKKGLKVIHQ